jgi:transposase
VGSRVEQFEQIRRDREVEGLSIRALAERHGVHRRTVRQALASAIPPPRRRPEGRPAPVLGPYRALIDEWLTADRKAPPKQRHTARRIWQRLAEEHGAAVAEPTVRKYVRARRREIGPPGEAYVPQLHRAGAEAEVDWGEATVVLRGEPVEVGLFHMRACHSGAGFCIAFWRQTQQAFLEGHVEAFTFFGGVFPLVRYDNLSAAVKRVLWGRRRVETDRLVALRSHYLFASQYTLVGRQGAHEKGGVESEVGRFRRRHLVPVPRVGSLAELNQRVRAASITDLGRRIAGRPETVADALARERALLGALPADPYQAAEIASPRVDQKALVNVRQSRYSVPVGLVGLRVACEVGAREILIRHDGREVARHERSYERFAMVATLDHYLDLLRDKPAALAGSLALHQERERGAWPAALDELWAKIADRYGASEAARHMVEVLLLAREVGPEAMIAAAAGALAAGAHDGRAVALLARRAARAPAPALAGLPERLTLTERPAPTLDDYDELLGDRGGAR